MPRGSALSGWYKGIGILAAVTFANAMIIVAPAHAQDAFGVGGSQEATEAYVRGDYQTAANLWLMQAYEGSNDAKFNLGVMYIEGKGVPQSREQGVFWFVQAANADHAEAQYNLGHLYFENQDDAEAIATGVGWWRRSAELGFPLAQFNYGRALFFGVGTKVDLPSSKFWMEQAAGHGQSAAAGFLKNHADQFDGIESNRSLALTLKSPSPEPDSRKPDATTPATTGTAVAASAPLAEEQPVTAVPQGEPEVANRVEPDPVTETPDPVETKAGEAPLQRDRSARDESTDIADPVSEAALTIDEYVDLLADGGGLPQIQPVQDSPEPVTESAATPTETEQPDTQEDIARYEPVEPTVENVQVGEEPPFVDQFATPAERRQGGESAEQRIIYNDNQWLYAREPESVTFQLLRIKDRAMALNLYAGLEGQGKLFSTVADHYRWYFILLGDFPDRSSAEAWRDNLPEWAANAPHIGFGDLQKERCAQARFLTGDETKGLVDFCRI